MNNFVNELVAMTKAGQEKSEKEFQYAIQEAITVVEKAMKRSAVEGHTRVTVTVPKDLCQAVTVYFRNLGFCFAYLDSNRIRFDWSSFIKEV